MSNPFEKRASEYRRDDEAFLPLVTPDPLITFFKKSKHFLALDLPCLAPPTTTSQPQCSGLAGVREGAGLEAEAAGRALTRRWRLTPPPPRR